MVEMNFSRFKPVFIVCIIVCNAFELSAQDVRNVISRIEGKIIIISYDLLVETPDSECEVKIYFGNSTSQKLLLNNATGDFGSNIKVGNQKQVSISDLTPFIPYQTDLTFRIEAVYTYNPETGTISVNTEPAGARVYLDDASIGNSDILLTNKNVGPYKLKIEKEGFLTIEKEIEVLDGQTTAVIETLIPGYAATIISNPDKAEIRVNGTYIGETPAQVVLKPGINNIELSAKDYQDFSTTITPKKQDEKFEFLLTQKGYQITIITYPKKTKINLEGANYADTDTLKVTGESKKLTVSKKQYKTSTITIHIEDLNKTQRFHILLEPEVYRKKGAALVYSLLLPGMGQRYLKRKGVEPLMGVVGYGLLAGSLSKYNSAANSYDLYLEKTDIKNRAELKQQWQNEKKQSENMLYGAVAIWAGNLLWTLLSKDEEGHYQKMKTKIKFDNLTNTGEISILFQLRNSKKRHL